MRDTYLYLKQVAKSIRNNDGAVVRQKRNLDGWIVDVSDRCSRWQMKLCPFTFEAARDLCGVAGTSLGSGGRGKGADAAEL